MASGTLLHRWSRLFVVLVGMITLTNCATYVRTTTSNRDATALRNQLVALSPHVRTKEAEQVADCACVTSRQLARDYRVVGPPLFHNFLVNVGVRQRGLCFHWARDLFAKLNQLPLRTLELHWGAARAGTWREHNCVVVTAKGQRFENGVILDAWRNSGRLFWSSLRADHYPWIEDEAERIRLTSKRREAILSKSFSQHNVRPTS